MGGQCVYCDAGLSDPDRCGACGKGQPVEVVADAEGVDPPARIPAGTPGTFAFLLGAILALVGMVVPFVSTVGYVFMIGAVFILGDAILQRLPAAT